MRFRRTRATACLAQHAVAGIVPGDHVCASFGSDDEQRALVGGYARQALRRGERFLYFLHSSDDKTIHGYLEQAGIDVDAGIALGQIELRRFQHDQVAIDPEAIIAGLEADRGEALRHGYSALSATSEMSWTLTRPDELDAAVRYERNVTRIFAAANITSVCQYDRRLFEPAVLDRLVSTHEFQVSTSPNATRTVRRRLTVTEHDDGAVAVSGALDIDSSAFLTARLADFHGDGDVVVLTDGLDFADVSGCRALLRAAEALGEGRRLVLPEPAAPLVRVLKLCGWSEHGRLVLHPGGRKAEAPRPKTRDPR
ncbi:MAG TPA: MEDS domain-containing protein [Solirubrobacteraceae bacterium]|nr:MEDS domain-containing protein [Solirubrobacteraceae bacterium]